MTIIGELSYNFHNVEKPTQIMKVVFRDLFMMIQSSNLNLMFASELFYNFHNVQACTDHEGCSS
jgi:hypothetical protein